MASYHEVMYDDGDQYKGQWQDGKVRRTETQQSFLRLALARTSRVSYGSLSRSLSRAHSTSYGSLSRALHSPSLPSPPLHTPPAPCNPKPYPNT